MAGWLPGVLYQVYPRSFADANGDGVGDIRGVIDHLDHLAWLGVDAVWLSPITVSPNVDFGYDVADYCDINPDLGTLADVDELIAAAGQNGIQILLDLVPNHTSDQHPWFQDARSSRDAEHRDWYVWRDLGPDGSPPNNWVSTFGGSAWQLDPPTDQAYLHNFAVGQPDLNWWHDGVRAAFEEIQRFWLDRGIGGFRLDVCHMLVKDMELRDNPPAEAPDGFVAQLLGQRMIYNANRPEVHDILRSWRALADTYTPPRVLMGETVVHDLTALARFYGTGTNELHLALNVPFQESSLEGLPAVVEATLEAFPEGATPLWSGSNHDIPRLATHWGQGDARRTRVALMLLLTLPGTALLFQGDEIGLPDTPLAYDDIVDPVGHLLWPAHPGRDPARTPMPWTDDVGGGFTRPDVPPWLPFGDLTAHNVRSQRNDPTSTLHLVRDLIATRRGFAGTTYVRLAAEEGVWVYRCGDQTLVALNLTDRPVSLDALVGEVAIGTDRGRDGELLSGPLKLAAWEGVVITEGKPL